MGANNIQQSLLDAMQLLSNKAANSTNAAITIKGEIIEELDSSIHQYKVSYGGAIYKDVYAQPGSTYSSSTIVWILVPDGNFDNPKLILGAILPSSTEYVVEEESDIYIPITTNLFGSESNVNLRSWINETKNVSIDTSSFGLIFSDYLKTYKNFVFTAQIKTEIDKDHQFKGNYGLILNLPFLEANSEGTTSKIYKSYIMDVSTIQGNPYAFNEYQTVNLYYTIDDTLVYDTSRNPYISAFTQDFGYVNARTDIQYDIHIKNIAVKMVDVLSEADTTGYYLAVVASEGNYFLSGKYASSKTLTPILKVNAKETDITKWDCYWFVEDTSINTTSDGYSTLGGIGWKCLNKKTNITYDTEGNKTFQYVTDDYSYTVQVSDVTSMLRYKCVLTKDDVVVGGSVRLKNLNSAIETSLVSATGSNSFVESIGNVTLIARIYYPGVTNATKPSLNLSTAWQRFDKDGNYIDNDFYTVNRYNDKVVINGKSYYETEISYPCTKLEKLNTVNCTFYSTTTKNGDVVQNNLGTESIIVTTTKDLTYGITMSGGDVLYKYDSDGDSPMVADYDGPASSKIKTIQPITFKVFKPDGSELTDLEYRSLKYTWSFPKNSMMSLSSGIQITSEDDNYYYITGWGKSSVNYTILNTYNKKKSNNTILISVEFDGNQISDSVNPKFLKDGEGGTNGSKYAAVLTYQSYAYGERDSNGRIRKLQAVYIAGTGWRLYDVASNSLVAFGSPNLSVNVYRDGERITSGYTLAWNMFDSVSTDPCFSIVNGTVHILTNWDDANNVYCSIVECAITIDDISRTNSQEVIYAYYPIEISRLIDSSLATKVIPTLDGGFEEVVYTSDGTNPQYDNTNPFTCTDNLYNDNSSLYQYNWTVSNNLKLPSGTGYTSAIRPVTKYDNGQSKNYVKVVLTMSSAKRTEVTNKITALTTQISNTQNSIAFYQHDKQNVLDFAQNFNYNNYIGYLNKAKNILHYRFTLLNLIPSLRQILEELNEYCINKNIKINDFNYTRYYTDYNNTLNSAYNNLYLFGNTRTFTDLYDLAGLGMEFNEATLVSNYGPATANQIKIYVNSWTSLIQNYQNTYTELVKQQSRQYIWQTEYNNLHTLDTTLLNLPNDNYLNNLTTTHDGSAPVQEFVNLKAQITALVNQISDTSDDILSYSAFVENILKSLQGLINIYQNTSYQTAYYNKILADLNVTLTDYQSQKASYEKALLPASANYIIHIKPIVMLYNRYELSHINGWDGNKLYTGGGDQEYLLAPQVGAGAKKNGLFTGVLMGVKQFNKTTIQHIGLFGYSSGIQSLFINAEDGSAIFGKSGGGQITIDPDGGRGYLYSANYWNQYKDDGKPSNYTDSNKAYKGMLINLTDSLIHLGSAESGRIYSGHHSSLGNTDTGFYLSHDGLSIGKYFTVYTGTNNTDKNGQAVINQEQSTLGDWRIKTVTVYDSNGNSSQRRCFVSKLDSNGNFNDGIILDSANSTIVLGSPENGRIYSGEHYKLNDTKDGFYIGRDGLSIGSAFVVNTDGTATVEHDGSSIGQWKIRQVEVTDTAGNKSTKQCITSKSNQEGIYLDATNSTIVLGSSSGRIYSGQHYQWSSKTEGFYISDQGLSIGEDFYVQGKNTGGQAAGTATVNQENSTIGQWKINTVQIQTGVDANDQPIYKTVKSIVSNKNQGIFLDAPDSTIVLGSSQGKIYSGKHYQLGSTKEGFYLSNEGLSIGSNFTIVSDGTSNITHENSNIGQWKLTGDGTNQKLASTRNGILLDAPNSRIILGGSEGEIYSGNHTFLNSTDNGFYLSNQGLSIGSKFFVDAENSILRLGLGAVNGSSTRYWTINSNGNESYISYNTDTYNKQGITNSVYIGTNGISLGYNKFYVDNSGYLTAKEGSLAGWDFDSTSIHKNNIYINSNGSIEHKNEGTSNWSISSSGYAYFKDVSINGVRLGSTFGNMGYNDRGFNYGTFGGSSYYGCYNNIRPFSGGAISHIESISADYIYANYLKAMYARIDTLEADNVTIHGTLDAHEANIESLWAETANINNLVATKANISDLNATNANVTNLTAEVANVRSLAASKVTADYVDSKISAFAAAAYFDSITVGGTSVSGGVTFNVFSSDGSYYGQATCLGYMNN